MSTDAVFADPTLEALRKRFFPRVPWGQQGPVRRRYLARAAREGQTVAQALEALALSEGFITTGVRYRSARSNASWVMSTASWMSQGASTMVR